MRIQHNIMALNAYRNYNTNTSALAKNLEKLSSGYRINRAGDDAAGLAISEKMRAQITGLNAAQKNVKDGVSLVKTAEGAMQEIQDMLNRMDYLATQSANGTYDSEVDRKNLQKEVEQLKSEINRIADSSNFNGTKLLDGSLGEKTTAADAAAIGLQDASAAITHIADAASAPDPQRGKFTLDLTEVRVTNNGIKADVTDPGTLKTASKADGTAGADATDPADDTAATFEVALTGATIAKADGAGATAVLTVGGQKIEFDVSSAADMDDEAIVAAIKDKKITIDGQEYTASIKAGNADTILFTSTNKGTSVTAPTDNTAVTLTAGKGADASVNIDVAFGAAGEFKLGDGVELGYQKTYTGAEIAEKIMAQTEGKITIDGVEFNVTNNKGLLTFEMKDIPSDEFTTDLTASLKVNDGNGRDLAIAGGVNANKNDLGSVTIQGEGIGVHMIQQAVAPGAQAQAQASLDIMTAVGGKIRDGSALKIGNETYIFALGKESEFKNFKGDAKIVDLTDQKDDAQDTPAGITTLSQIAARRLSAVSTGNTMFDISTNNVDGTVRLTERKNSGIDYSKNNLEGADKSNLNDATDGGANPWENLVQFGRGVAGAKAASTSGGLQLQIGDTSDSFNQLVVKVGDMHTKALGIADLDITNPESAASAIQTIRDAINYVSSTRGDLGATQNRLEHTANNLSVMAENIQDAESTIRDTDVAEEMMAYTKNNILIQSAQAMLAQANAVPQGVLQLLG